jgi:hypothetical protein
VLALLAYICAQIGARSGNGPLDLQLGASSMSQEFSKPRDPELIGVGGLLVAMHEVLDRRQQRAVGV